MYIYIYVGDLGRIGRRMIQTPSWFEKTVETTLCRIAFDSTGLVGQRSVGENGNNPFTSDDRDL